MWAALGTEVVVYGFLLGRAWLRYDTSNPKAFEAALAMAWYALGMYTGRYL